MAGSLSRQMCVCRCVCSASGWRPETVLGVAVVHLAGQASRPHLLGGARLPEVGQVVEGAGLGGGARLAGHEQARGGHGGGLSGAQQQTTGGHAGGLGVGGLHPPTVRAAGGRGGSERAVS